MFIGEAVAKEKHAKAAKTKKDEEIILIAACEEFAYRDSSKEAPARGH